jgi:hypothetical protein
MAKSRAENQSANLTPDQKSKIALKYVHVHGMPHIIGNLLTKATTFLETSSQ